MRNAPRMYGGSSGVRRGGDEIERWGEIITHLRRCMATRDRSVATQSNVIRNTSIRKKGHETGEKKGTTTLEMGEDSVQFSKQERTTEKEKQLDMASCDRHTRAETCPLLSAYSQHHGPSSDAEEPARDRLVQVGGRSL